MQKNQINILIINFISFISYLKVSRAFPPECKWEKNANFICKNGGLRRVPKDVPTTAFSIDLSNNIQLEFQEDYFLRFDKLEILILSNCSVNHAILLPSSIRFIQLSKNSLTKEAIRKTFANNSPHIHSIDLSSNELVLDQVIQLIPKGIKYLNLFGNSLPTIKKR